MGYLLKPRPRPLRVCYINYESRLIDETLHEIESELEKIHEFEIVPLDNLDSPEFQPCDLLLLIAHQSTSDHLLVWVKQLAQRLKSRIWTPTVIMGQLGHMAVRDLVGFAVESNWYFDVLNTEHVTSLSLRMANLIRIHDHLHEMFRYENTLTQLEQRIDTLQTQVKHLQPKKG